MNLKLMFLSAFLLATGAYAEMSPLIPNVAPLAPPMNMTPVPIAPAPTSVRGLNADDEKQIKALIEELASNNFADREAAQKALEELRVDDPAEASFLLGQMLFVQSTEARQRMQVVISRLNLRCTATTLPDLFLPPGGQPSTLILPNNIYRRVKATRAGTCEDAADAVATEIEAIQKDLAYDPKELLGMGKSCGYGVGFFPDVTAFKAQLQRYCCFHSEPNPYISIPPIQVGIAYRLATVNEKEQHKQEAYATALKTCQDYCKEDGYAATDCRLVHRKQHDDSVDRSVTPLSIESKCEAGNAFSHLCVRPWAAEVAKFGRECTVANCQTTLANQKFKSCAVSDGLNLSVVTHRLCKVSTMRTNPLQCHCELNSPN